VSSISTIVYRKETALRIASLRQLRQISKAASARLLGISRPTLYELEAGSRRLFVDELLIISRALNVSVDWLLGRNANPHSWSPTKLSRPQDEQYRDTNVRLKAKWFQLFIFYVAVGLQGFWPRPRLVRQPDRQRPAIEGINSLVQAAKAKARGYRSVRNLKTMIYLLAGKLDLRLPA
jgi:transcriptional regulator with XRE-family HTH domain